MEGEGSQEQVEKKIEIEKLGGARREGEKRKQGTNGVGREDGSG